MHLPKLPHFIDIQNEDTDSDVTEPRKPEYKLCFTAVSCIETIRDMIQRATVSIDIEAFYFIPDAVGRELLNMLVVKAKQGIKVRVLADTMGSFSLSQSMYIEALQKAGGHIRFFNSVIPFSRSKKSFWYFRNHRRSVIIDNTELFIGSFCIGEPTTEWIETAVLIRKSVAIIQAKRAFKETWGRSLHPTFKIGRSSKLSTDCFSYITQAPLQRQRYIYKFLINDIKAAKKEIMLVAPYIIPDRRLVRALNKAHARGVKIIILTSRKTDSRLADLARNTYITKMLEHGFNVYLSDRMIHSKVSIFDEQKAYIGTLNLDSISLRYNYESTVITDSEACVSELYESINSLSKAPMDPETNTQYLTLEKWNQRGTFTKFLEKLIWPIRKFF